MTTPEMNPLDHIRDLADELTEPHINREPYTVQHGLLTQLYRAVLPTSLAEDGTVPASKPPLELEALSRHQEITDTANRWATGIGVKPRTTYAAGAGTSSATAQSKASTPESSTAACT